MSLESENQMYRLEKYCDKLWTRIETLEKRVHKLERELQNTTDITVGESPTVGRKK